MLQLENIQDLEVSSSGLKAFMKHPRAFYDYKQYKDRQKKPSFELGKLVDKMLTEVDSLSDTYAEINFTYPSGKGEIVLRHILSKIQTPEGEISMSLEDLDKGLEGPLRPHFEEGYKLAEYAASTSIETVFNAFLKKGKEVIAFYIANGSKILIDSATMQAARAMAESVRAHKAAAIYFIQPELSDVTYFNQVDFHAEVLGVKAHCIPDVVTYDPNSHVVTIVSLKTSKSQYLEDYKSIITDYKYYIQEMHEVQVVGQNFASKVADKKLVINYVYVFVSSTAPYLTRVVASEYNKDFGDEYVEVMEKFSKHLAANNWELGIETISWSN